ncbi:MAG: hypothetical protein AMS17_03875 [Spirochaetes bacterium DG_61]|nr:MAG: hypothetical protein AMS17_03875 [Spirochaetes bacterium DG_61]
MPLKGEKEGKKTKVLILEDSEERRRVFRKQLSARCDLYFFDRVEEAKRALDRFGPFALIYLDHDLDGRIYVDSEEENTGYQLAKYIAHKNLKAEIIIHTMNLRGAARMREVLPHATHIAFPDLFPWD